MIRSIFFFILIALFGCSQIDDDVPAGSQLLRNTDISSPNSPQPWVSVSAPGVQLGVSNDTFRSSSASLFIQNLDSTNQEPVTWRQTVNPPLPGEGRQLRLRAYLKGEDIERFAPGSNVFISFRAFPVEDSRGNTFGRFITSSNRFVVEGTFEWRPIELVLNQMPPEVDFIIVYLSMAPSTTGQIFFDDITLTVD